MKQPYLLILHLLTLYIIFWPAFFFIKTPIYREQVYPQPVIKILCIKHIKIETKSSC